ncbi:MAG: N-6 DNA methylase [Cyclobacteriaceae bacterium]|nr:N-6 DNA methylase [Cyclobacteriaceae bacterium]
MLDNTTKKNIDDCRDVLVGKVPDPKSQIEQITLALIYKFMDDMDKEAVEKFKGKAKFFTGEYAKYGWRKLFDQSLSGQEMLALYSEALEKLNTNPNIPELFRNIFKNAYLPYRDPSTLKLFLKHINEFEYSHSEKLGDAFEYLLSVMGSQGDAGQFRTPRHIIDFVTACVNPQKNETVLDPACGTAGFLLSAYKHILQSNTDKRVGDKLKPEERKNLANNFAGYDISPDMVRLSLANMYLHGFATPQIHEYDTLSSEDRWQETFDVILANPPFMTPKGGIRPHKKFGVQANKAEVLFTDYIAEHLNPNGRAGIVVPNGIVATSQTAYKQLRKMLVQDSLLAVISLPAGVFQPYSGVKTSILILDKKLAKKSSHILFLKIENDGFDLGAQRREIEKNDLPEALEILTQYKDALSNDLSIEEIEAIIKNPKDSNVYRTNTAMNNTTPKGSNTTNNTSSINIKSLRDSIATLVEKQTVLENKDVVLSGERYLSSKDFQTEYDKIKLVDVLDYEQPTKYIVESENYDDSYKTPVLTAGKTFILGYTNETEGIFTDDLPVIIFDDFTTATKFVDFPFKVKSSAMKILKVKPELADIRYLFYVMQQIEFNSEEHKRYWISQYSQLQIPLPPLEIQQQIVAEIEGYQKIIDGAKQIVNNYKPAISINPDWEMVELGEVCEVNPKKSEAKNIDGNTLVSFVPMADLNENEISFIPKEEKILSEVINGYTYFADNDVLFAKVTPCFENGKAGIAKGLRNKIGFGSSEFFVLRANDKVLPMWLYLNIKSQKFSISGKEQMSGTSGLQRIPREFVIGFQIPLPPLSEQQSIVAAIEEEMNLVNANKKLIEIFEQKIKSKISEVWGVKEEATASR